MYILMSTSQLMQSESQRRAFTVQDRLPSVREKMVGLDFSFGLDRTELNHHGGLTYLDVELQHLVKEKTGSSDVSLICYLIILSSENVIWSQSLVITVLSLCM